MLKMVGWSVILVTVGCGSADAITLGQVDDFQDGTTQDWLEGLPSPSPPVNLPDGGPGGVGDHALRNTSSGISDFPGGRMIMFNTAQWSGDYLAAGVDQLEVMLRADPSSANELSIRVAVQGAFQERFVSSTPFELPNDGNWYAASFSLTDLVQVSGSQSLSDALADVSELRVLHNSVADWKGAVIAATLDMDDLTAAQVPEPSSCLPPLLGLLSLPRSRVKGMVGPRSQADR